jgi:hypothetical protein
MLILEVVCIVGALRSSDEYKPMWFMTWAASYILATVLMLIPVALVIVLDMAGMMPKNCPL